MKRGILLAAFGSGSPQGESTLKRFDAEVKARFPGIPVRWAFTSMLLRERLAAARKKTDSVGKALRKMWFEKYTHVAVQPLQCIPGREYAEVVAEAVSMQGPQGFAAIRTGTPLLSTDADVQAAARAVIRHMPADRRPGEAVVLMGHGARDPAVVRYEDLARAVYVFDGDVHVGAMSGPRVLEAILPRLRPGERAWLMPLLSTVGRHTLQDMAGAHPESWRSRLEAAGMRCVPVLRGTAEYAGFINIWLEHLAEAVTSLE